MVTPPIAHRARQVVRLVTLISVFAAFVSLAACNQSPAQKSAVAVESLVIPVYKDGFYRLTYDDLQEVGADLSRFENGSTETQLPRLSYSGAVVPTLFWRESLLFYGRAPSDRYAAYQPYVLDLGQSGPPIRSQQLAPAGQETPAAVPFLQTYEENRFYDGRPYAGLPEDPALRQPWYWETIQAQARLTIEFDLPREPVGEATLTLELVGVSSNSQVAEDHDLDVVVNERRLQTIRWDGETAVKLAVDVPEGLLAKGANRLVLDNTMPGSTPIDIARLDRFTLSYLAEPLAINGLLQTEEVTGALNLTGFQDRPLLFDLNQPDAPVLLVGAEFEGDQATLTMDDQTKLFAVEPAALLQPQTLWPRSPAELARPTNQADFVIISPEAYIPALEPLAVHRRSQGISVKLVSQELIYREYAETGTGPTALSAFVIDAYDNWMSPKPAYLLLVGDATLDYRGYLDQGSGSPGQEAPPFLPAPVVPVTFSGETVSDARLADVDGDRRPELAVGRWPVNDVDEVEELVRRTIENDSLQASPLALFVADGSETRFADLNAHIGQEVGLDQAQAVYLNGPTNQELNQDWGQGAWLVTYTGHGSLDRWGKDTILDSETAPALKSDGASPIVLQLTCLTGLFAHPTIASLAEVMLLGEDGPLSIVAATSLTLSEHQQPFGVAFLKALQDPEVARVGDAFQQAKAQLDLESDNALREISDTFTLFGDPTALIRRPGPQ